MKRNTKKAWKQTLLVVLTITACLVMLSVLANRNDDKKEPVLQHAVLQHKPTVEKYAREYHVEEYVDILLAMMAQESGGRGNDPMQSSESYCGSIGCIQDPELSIKQGVYYFSETLKEADYDLELAIQSYNFGKGFIHYVKDNGKQFSQEIAIEFSRKMYQNAKDPSIYSCLRKEAKQYDACYGDIYYVKAVMGHVNKITEKE
jgi:Lysozyme-like